MDELNIKKIEDLKLQILAQNPTACFGVQIPPENKKTDIITSKKYRFTVSSSSFSGLDYLVKTFDFSVSHKSVLIEVYDIIMIKDGKWQDNPWMEWAEKFTRADVSFGVADPLMQPEPTNESLILTTYDSFGTPIMQYTFTNVCVFHAGSRFDYTDPDEHTIKISCNYDTVERKFLYDKD